MRTRGWPIERRIKVSRNHLPENVDEKIACRTLVYRAGIGCSYLRNRLYITRFHVITWVPVLPVNVYLHYDRLPFKTWRSWINVRNASVFVFNAIDQEISPSNNATLIQSELIRIFFVTYDKRERYFCCWEQKPSHLTAPFNAVVLRLLPTFAGALRQKNRTCVSLDKTPTNYIS